MLYLISGASRSGKTIIAHNILKQQQIPYVSLDWLVMGFTNGIPEYGIHDRLLPNEIAERLWSFLKAMCESMLWLEGDYVIDNILDTAGQKGTGKWTAVSAMEMGIPLTLISEAVLSRFLSSLKAERVEASKVLSGSAYTFEGDKQAFIQDIHSICSPHF